MKHQLRNDVQGLRAVAVLLVYVSHAGSTLLPGGFVGVDVFFVISGYVITLSLLKEYVGSNNIKILRFYARRFVRLIPALFFVLLITNLLALTLLAPFEQAYNYPSLNSALIWFSNFYFLNLDGSYFDVSSSEYLYIHTWSLGVEEQFYLIWPLVILFGIGYFSTNKGTTNIDKASILIVSLGIASFFLSMDLMIAGENNRAFYLMPARAWQFALGAYVALYHFRLEKTEQNPNWYNTNTKLRTLIGFVGLVLILLSAYLFSDEAAYPSWRVIIPTLGTSMLIASQFKNGNTTFIGKILCSPALLWLGALSYSLYLWHWPVLYFQSKIDQSITFNDALAAFALTVLLSTITYYCIENPLRSKLSKFRRWQIIIVFSVITAMMFTISLASKAYTMSHIADADQQKIMASRNQTAASPVYASGCDTWYYSAQTKPCLMDTNDQKFDNEVYLIGDSIATQWFSIIRDYYKNKNWKVTILTKSSCPMVDQPFFYKRIRAIYTVCADWRKSVIKLIAQNRPALVILGGSSSYPYSREQWLSGSKSVIGEIAKSAEKIVVLGESGGLGFDGPLCLARESWRAHFIPKVKTSSCYKSWQEPESLKWLRQVSDNYDNTKYLDFNDLICSDKCYAKTGEIVTFRDSQHLTAAYVDALSPKVLERLNKLVESF